MATLSQLRADVAAAVNAVDPALRVKTREVRQAKADDGWVIVRSVTPATYAACDATLVVLVILGADQQRADERFDALAVALVDALTKGVLHPQDVTAEPVTVLVGDPAVPMYALTLTLTLEVS